MNAQQLSTLLTKKLSRIKEYEDALRIAETNAVGDIWLIGGAVSRTLANELFGTPQETYDFDFLVTSLRDPPIVPDAWVVTHEKFGNPTFTKGSQEVDLFPIQTSFYIQSNKLPPTIENFLAGTPFTIQALAYSIKSKKLIGAVGITALLKRELRVNNRIQAEKAAERKNISLKELLKKKAESMGFSVA